MKATRRRIRATTTTGIAQVGAQLGTSKSSRKDMHSGFTVVEIAIANSDQPAKLSHRDRGLHSLS